MSNRYMIRQPIRNHRDEIIGYEMVYHGENQAFSAGSDAAKEFVATDQFYSIINRNTVKSLCGTLNFMTFNTALLMKKFHRMFRPEDLVIQIDDSVVLHPLSMYFVQKYAKEGYKIAVNQFEFSTRYMAIMDLIDYIRVDIRNLSPAALRNYADVAKGMHKMCIMTHIENKQQYEQVLALEVDGYEGPYVTERLQMNPRDKAFLSSDFFSLLYEITRDVPDYARVERMIAENPSLSYGLLKGANSKLFAFRSRPSTVSQALSAVGFGQLKQWLFLLGINPADPSNRDGLGEFLRLSFMRAMLYQELMRYSDDIPLSISEGYLMGMLSTLDKLIAVPAEQILEKLELPSVFMNTLVYREGVCGQLFDLIHCLELADWDGADRYSEQLGIHSEDMIETYFSCVEKVDTMWRKINTPYIPDPE